MKIKMKRLRMVKQKTVERFQICGKSSRTPLIGRNPTNTPRRFHVETTWKRPFPRRFNVESTWFFVGKESCKISVTSGYTESLVNFRNKQQKCMT